MPPDPHGRPSERSIAWNGLAALPRTVLSIPNDGRARALSHHHKLTRFTELAYLQRGGETRLCGWEFGFRVGGEEEVEVECCTGRWRGSALHPCHPTHPLLFSSNRIQARYPWTLACPVPILVESFSFFTYA